jgi:hypothetical protein
MTDKFGERAGGTNAMLILAVSYATKKDVDGGE